MNIVINKNIFKFDNYNENLRIYSLFLHWVPIKHFTKQTDAHSSSNSGEVTVTHSYLNLQLCFDKKLIIGKVTHHINTLKSVDKLRLDIRDIKIKQVVLNYELTTSFNLGD